MESLQLAQITADLTVELARRADQDPNDRRAWYHRINFGRPNPRFNFTATGLMLSVCNLRIGGIYRLLTPWGELKICDYDGVWSARCVEELLAEFDAQLVSYADPVYTQYHWGSERGLKDVFALRRFGGVELPEATSTRGLATGLAAQYPGMLQTYPNDYPAYWAKVREWGVLYDQLDATPTQRRDADIRALSTAR